MMVTSKELCFWEYLASSWTEFIKLITLLLAGTDWTCYKQDTDTGVGQFGITLSINRSYSFVSHYNRSGQRYVACKSSLHSKVCLFLFLWLLQHGFCLPCWEIKHHSEQMGQMSCSFKDLVSTSDRRSLGAAVPAHSSEGDFLALKF